MPTSTQCKTFTTQSILLRLVLFCSDHHARLVQEFSDGVLVVPHGRPASVYKRILSGQGLEDEASESSSLQLDIPKRKRNSDHDAGKPKKKTRREILVDREHLTTAAPSASSTAHLDIPASRPAARTFASDATYDPPMPAASTCAAKIRSCPPTQNQLGDWQKSRPVSITSIVFSQSALQTSSCNFGAVLDKYVHTPTGAQRAPRVLKGVLTRHPVYQLSLDENPE
eukprot:3232615-Amphidinium_carterae.1